MSVGENVVPGGARFEPRVYNYEPYHVGANLITNSLYCRAFQNWLYTRVENALYLIFFSSSSSLHALRDQRGTKKDRERYRRPKNNVLMMKERNLGESVLWNLCTLPMPAIAVKRD